jgi:hypothetical protein
MQSFDGCRARLGGGMFRRFLVFLCFALLQCPGANRNEVPDASVSEPEPFSNEPEPFSIIYIPQPMASESLVALIDKLDTAYAQRLGVSYGLFQQWKRNGKLEANRDIARSVLKLRTWGFPSSNRGVHARLLRQQLGVVLETVGGCEITPQLEVTTQAYNSRMESEIAKRFGPDALHHIDELVDAQMKEAVKGDNVLHLSP